MIDILILIVMLCGLLCICQILSPNNILTPQFGFVGCFIPQLVYALFYVKYWDLQLSTMTFWILLLSPIEFVLISLGMGIFKLPKETRTYHIKNKHTIIGTKDRQEKIKISKIFLILFLVGQVLVLIFVIRFLKENFSSSSLSAAIYSYRHTNLFGDDKRYLPKWLAISRIFSCASGYFWMYPLVHSFVYRYKNNFVLLSLNIVMSAANTIVLGGRGGLIQMAAAIVVQFYFIKGQKESWSRKIDLKMLARILVLLILAIAIFQMSAGLLGRDVSKYSFADYISIYLSAQLKNLDMFIREGNFGADMSRTQTMIYVANFLDGKFAFANGWSHELDLPFHKIHGKSLGNVCTIYYAFLYDGGWLAVVMYIALMAFICQCLFRVATSKKKSLIDISVITYSYVFFTIVFSFFSPKFYEMVFNPNFAKMIISWCLLGWATKFTSKFKLKFK